MDQMKLHKIDEIQAPCQGRSENFCKKSITILLKWLTNLHQESTCDFNLRELFLAPMAGKEQ